ncbi:hypothetical protein A2803_04310 [Candidatus Woesebacteria bacterium RIFCSPHIGHO2_01_FULL_44_21]|uniref:Uncharacterized protein n=1 Tax=Candidatus Woesebacteria bacterium RIFCSPHIGHO2_01_FULL_44_21 TaxID=1802503 RepID=A0A1F7Z3P7_9BACT|nr:MAG: hypothetical protein A2803_04310 [Candidatus Woesebacteria bacterium RIFCSPHIGHO2_01_FULL_44_21]OGM71492.1 MAG: hypothetical protein A2897_04195 [Candidatus Woesebacteria bacterium RIFCSPLOWO2_01_FULL_44_24b]
MPTERTANSPETFEIIDTRVDDISKHIKFLLLNSNGLETREVDIQAAKAANSFRRFLQYNAPKSYVEKGKNGWVVKSSGASLILESETVEDFRKRVLDLGSLDFVIGKHYGFGPATFGFVKEALTEIGKR